MKTNHGTKIALAALAFLLIAAASPFVSVTVDSITGALRGSSTNLFSANSNRLNSAVNLSSRVAKGGDTMTGTLAVPAITLNGTNLADLIGSGGGGGGGGGGAYQPTSGVLTAFAAATGGTSTNFYAGDGTYKQVTTNMVPGLVGALAVKANTATTAVGYGITDVEPLNANKYQRTNSALTALAAASGGNSTNFYSGDGTYKQVTTNMVPGLNAALAASEPLNANKYQSTNSALTTLAAASGGNSTNFYAGDGSFKQVTTNMIPGLVEALADGVASGGGGGGGGSYPSNIASVTITNTGNAVIGGNLDVTGSITIGGSNVSDVVEAQINSKWYFYRDYEFIGLSANRTYLMSPDLYGAPIGNGTIAITTSGSPITNHPGVFRLTGGTSPNNGYGYLTDPNALALSGGEFCEFIFRIPTTNASRVTFGFTDRPDSVNPYDGMVFRIAANLGEWGTVAGYVYSNSIAQGSSSSTNIIENTWYVASISNSIPKGTVTFRLLSESRDQIWSGTITSGMPTGAGREFGFGLVALSTNAMSTPVIDIDKIVFGVKNSANR